MIDRGKLYFFYGAMGSGKSMALIVKAYNFKERGLKVMVLKPTVDTRSTKIKSRTGYEVECVAFKPEDDIRTIIPSDLDWLIIDESQFMTPEQVDQISMLADNGMHIMCYGLRTDFRGMLFPGSKRLFELADTIEELKSTCSCGRKAIINARLVDGKVTTSGEQVVIGGNESYVPMCRDCWRKELAKANDAI